MAEYIEREALEKQIDEAQNELISNDDRIWERNKKYFKGLAWARRLLLDAPAADVVEVVRCKDCKSCFIYTKWNGTEYHGCRFNGEIYEVEPTHFCSYGERKE